MKLSILLVVLNNKAFIAQAMDNFVAQSCPDAELLVMDGASTDGTRHTYYWKPTREQRKSRMFISNLVIQLL